MRPPLASGAIPLASPASMDIILDTADTEAIRALDEVIDVAGVTTNPAIITRSGRPIVEGR